MTAFSHAAQGKAGDIRQTLKENAAGQVDAKTTAKSDALAKIAHDAAGKLAEEIGGTVEVTVYGNADSVTIGVRKQAQKSEAKSGAKTTKARKSGATK